MTNVLPENSQKRVWRLYRARFILAGSAVLLMVALLAFLLLLPSYLALQADESTFAETSPSGGGTHDQTDITRAQSLILTLGPILSGTTTPSEALRTALALRPRGVVVDKITYTPRSFILAGAAPRDAVNAYKNSLLSDSHFTSVSVPVGDLAGALGGRFSITLSGHF